MPKISIIVPVYNAENYLSKCVRSVLSQTFSDFELLLINDGSTDGSSTICQEYKNTDTRVRFFNKENGGVSSARNVGLCNARGEWITFIDSDDYVDNDYLENMINKSHGDFVASHMIAEGWKEWVDIPLPDCEWNNSQMVSFIERLLPRMNFMVCKLFRLSIIKSNTLRFNENLAYGEDTLFIIDYLKYAKSVATISSASYHYNCYNMGSLSKKKVDWDKLSNTIDLLCESIQKLKTEFSCDSCYFSQFSLINIYVSNYFQSLRDSNNFMEIYKALKTVNKNKNVRLLFRGHTDFPKSRQRGFFDFLMTCRCHIICSAILYYI